MFELQTCWAKRCLTSFLLLPIAGLFSAIAGLRRLAYRRAWLPSFNVGVPVIVVGNITAGGSGKTPLVIWLTNWLAEQGFRPGVVSRGYGGKVSGCVEVTAGSDPSVVGDEPLLIHSKTRHPVVVGRDRVAAARTLLARHPGIDLIVSDDGLQHYRLHRTLELAVIDASTGLGNGLPLPAGPLREPVSRLKSVDAVIEVQRQGTKSGQDFPVPAFRVGFAPGRVYRLLAPDERVEPQSLAATSWQAVTGIGRPQGFFDTLTLLGWSFKKRVFPDHHPFAPGDLPADARVVMTEKDAVKCKKFAQVDWWALELEARPEPAFIDWLKIRIGALNKKR